MHNRLQIYSPCVILYFLGHRHHVEGTNGFYAVFILQPRDRPCSHPFHCVRSFRNGPTTSRCDHSGTGPERVQLALWCERTTGPVPVASPCVIMINNRYILPVWPATNPHTLLDTSLSALASKHRPHDMCVVSGLTNFSDFRNSIFLIFLLLGWRGESLKTGKSISVSRGSSGFQVHVGFDVSGCGLLSCNFRC